MTHRKPLIIAAALSLAGQAGAELRVEDPSTNDHADLNASAVVFTTDGETLTVRVETNHAIDAFLREQAMAKDLVTLHFNTDGDEASGDTAIRGAARGIDHQVEIFACIAYEMGAEACAGGMGGAAISETYPKYKPMRWNASDEYFDDFHEWGWTGGRGDFDGAALVVSIPYADLGAEAGATLRFYLEGGVFDDFNADPIVIKPN